MLTVRHRHWLWHMKKVLSKLTVILIEIKSKVILQFKKDTPVLNLSVP